jgi:hypothetical protein
MDRIKKKVKYSHPIATVIECTRVDDVIRTRIHLDRTESRPYSPASLWLGDPPADKDAHAIFSLHRLIASTNDLYDFETYEKFKPQKVLVSKGSIYRFVGWWRPDQLTMAHRNPADLRVYHFIPKCEEDHDHCILCWKTISDCEDEDHDAYTDGYDSLCFECFEKYLRSGFGKMLGDVN